MLFRRKILLGLVVAIGLVGAGIGAVAIRSTHGDSPALTNTPEAAPAQPTDQDQKTPDQLGSAKPPEANRSSEANSTNAASNGTRRRYANSRVYYDYGNQPQGRTFWQKHRDKLTVAGGAGAGALVGGLIGGKKGAGIGLLAGGGSSALYTYKLRHKRH
jgi:hypothetical protein